MKLFRRLLDLASPRACHVCGHRLGVSENFVCPACLAALPLTRYHLDPYENPMARMFWGKMAVERVASLFFYQPNSHSGSLIRSIKYGYQRRMAFLMGRTMAREVLASGFFDGVDIIIPIPLSRRRQRERGYNQSELMALGISEMCGIPVNTGIVKRTKDNVSQTSLSFHERRENVRDIFTLISPEAVSGRHVLIVDDIMTTGATIVACAATLAEAGGVRFSVMTLGTTRQ